MRFQAASAMLDRAAIGRRLASVSPFRQWRHHAKTARQKTFASSRRVSHSYADLLQELDKNGLYTIPDLGSYLDDGSVAKTLDDAKRIIGGLQADHINSDDLFALSAETYLIGLDAKIVDLAELYLGEECLYLGCSLKRERASDSNAGTRQWHRDVEDDRLFRILVYLDAVHAGTGPFQYIPAGQSQQASRLANYKSGYLQDSVMAMLVDRAHWQTACGPPGTAVIFDGARIFHRASVPRDEDRFSLTLIYSTRRPLQQMASSFLGKANRRRLEPMLADWQKACLPKRRFLLGLRS